jgi:hypothetical protein
MTRRKDGSKDVEVGFSDVALRITSMFFLESETVAGESLEEIRKLQLAVKMWL